MTKLIFLGIIVVLCGTASADDPLWNNLKVTFGKFTDLPLTLVEAESLGWRRISGRDCRNNGQFQGYRYVDTGNSSVSVLYDVRGRVAGLQVNMLVDELKANGNGYNFDRVPMYQKNSIDGAAFYSLTAYIQQPGRICTIGRNDLEYEINGIGNDLYFQNGVNNYIKAPNNRQDALKTPIWSENNCFTGMGFHNFYSVDTWDADDCNSLTPVFLLYNNVSRLIGYGFDVVGTARSLKLENPGFTNIAPIIGEPLPQCVERIFSTVGVTTLHVYFTSNPKEITCT